MIPIAHAHTPGHPSFWVIGYASQRSHHKVCACFNEQSKMPNILYFCELLRSYTYYDNYWGPTFKEKSPSYFILCDLWPLQWVPDGRRLITGAFSGEFTLWNGINFSFESILQVKRQAKKTLLLKHWCASFRVMTVPFVAWRGVTMGCGWYPLTTEVSSNIGNPTSIMFTLFKHTQIQSNAAGGNSTVMWLVVWLLSFVMYPV